MTDKQKTRLTPKMKETVKCLKFLREVLVEIENGNLEELVKEVNKLKKQKHEQTRKRKNIYPKVVIN